MALPDDIRRMLLPKPTMFFYTDTVRAWADRTEQLEAEVAFARRLEQASPGAMLMRLSHGWLLTDGDTFIVADTLAELSRKVQLRGGTFGDDADDFAQDVAGAEVALREDVSMGADECVLEEVG